MKRVLIVIAGLVLAAAAYAAAFAALNGDTLAKSADIERRVAAIDGPAPDTLNLLVWNLGYGGLGRDSDFVADGGAHMFPPSRASVQRNVAGIVSTVEREAPSTDVLVFQEIARGGPVNYWVDLKAAIDRALADRSCAFFADFQTRLVPWPLRLTHGQAIYARHAMEDAEILALPAEDASIFGVKRRYAALITRLPRAQSAGWTIVSVHLAAFDADAAVRTRQLRQVLAWADAEYRRGAHVVLAGDWNLQLVDTHFPHRTDARFLFWLFPFPQDALPEGWRIAADASVPSVRTNHQPYVAGENYATTIDGFIVSPNVAVEDIGGIDLGFEHADHQPVRIRVRASDEGSER